jgi:protocatechuate 3,4-dioxygenase beta subunit
MLTLTFLALLSQAPPVQSAPAGAIEGIVVRAGSADGLSRATVEVRRDEDHVATPPGISPQLMSTLISPPLLATTTEADGRFLFPSVRPGRYRIVTTRPGYVPRPVTVTVAGGRSEQVQVTLNPTAAISGRVFGTNGEPVGNAEVEALKPTYQNGRRQLTAVTSVRTNDLGEYRLFWLPPGRYFVRATHAEGQVGLIVGMARFGGMTGSIMGNAGPNGNLFAMRSSSDSTLIESAISGNPANEEYVPIYFPGTIDDQAATAVDLNAGAEASGIDIRVAPLRRRHVRGAVINGATGEIAQYAGLKEAQGDTPFGPGQPGGTGLSRNGESPIEPDGTFHVTLLPGRHTLIGTAGTGTGYLTIDVRDADIDNLRIVAMPAFDVAGRILSDGPVDTKALANIRINLQRDLPVPLAPGSYSQPRDDGTFTVEATPGDYRLNVAPLLNVSFVPARFPLNVSGPLENVYVKAIRVGNVDVLNNGVHLEGPPANPLEIVIGTNPGALEGAVTTGRQTPAAGTTVVVLPAVRDRFDLIKTTATDPAGRFRLDRLPPGDYRVFAWEEVSDGAWQDPEFMRTYEERGTPIRVAEGATERVALVAMPGP